jgi:hypothetical protein
MTPSKFCELVLLIGSAPALLQRSSFQPRTCSLIAGGAMRTLPTVRFETKILSIFSAFGYPVSNEASNTISLAV